MKRLIARLLAVVPLASRRPVRIPHSAFHAFLGLALICLLSLLLIRIIPADNLWVFLDESWQGNWQANWAIMSGSPYSDTAGLHQGYQWYATVRYSGYITADHTAAVSTSCGPGDPENTLEYWTTIRSDSTGNLGYQAHFVGSSDQGNWYSLSAVTSSGTYVLGSTTGIGCDTGITMSAVGSIITAGGLGAWDDRIASGTVAITILDEGRDGAVTRVVISGGDYNPPTVPQNLHTELVLADGVSLAWNPSSDEISGVDRYKVRRNGEDYAEVLAPTTRYDDRAVQPSSNYSYAVVAVDRQGNPSAPCTPLGVTTPSAANLRPEGLGVSPLGAYYGSGSEQVNLESGNLVLRFPLIPLQGRTPGTSPSLSLVYNSQIWVHDGNPAHAAQLTAIDAGVGLGWSLWLGAIYPVSAAQTVDHYRFIDSSGATHRLYPSTGDTYVSRDSTYLKWDRVLHRLWFRDGTFWDFDYASGGGQDFGTRYPTKIQDTNGNYVNIYYSQGARITKIEDSRYSSSPTATHYEFFYQNGRLASIKEGSTGNWLVRFGFVYQDATVSAPFGTQQSISATRIQQVKPGGQGSTPTLSYGIDYNLNGEPSRLTLPYGGYFEYEYGNGSFSNVTVVRREVSARKYCSLALGDTHRSPQGCSAPYLKTEQFDHPDDVALHPGHDKTRLVDAAGNRKIWRFTQDHDKGWKNGLQEYQEVHQWRGPGLGFSLLRTFQTDWTQDDPEASGLRNPRPSAQRTILNDVTPNLESRRTQTVDSNGNVTEVGEFGYGDANPYRTRTVTYLTGTAYTQRNILDRTTGSEVHEGGPTGTTRLSSVAYYDQFALTNMTPAPDMHDAAYNTSLTARGNTTTARPLGGNVSTQTYDILGKARTVTDGAGHQQTMAYSASTGYTVPSSTNSNTPIGASMQWNGDLTLSSASAASGESVSYAWDSGKRPSSFTSPSGSHTEYIYNDMAQPPTVVQTTQVHTGGGPPNYTLTATTYTITRTLDGFGRVVKTEDSRAGATVLYEYDVCSCSASGRQTSVSNPYNPNDPSPNNVPKWTLTAYDALGRVQSVTAPDTSVTTTLYRGNATQVEEPHAPQTHGRMKRFTYDAFGNLTQVAEAPTSVEDGWGTYSQFTNYTYNTVGRLTDVWMNGTAQHRQFTYNDLGQVTSATNPENGTVAYSYNTDGTLASKTDAKNQVTLFQYDTYRRLTRIYPGGSYGFEKRFYYDEYPSDPGEHTYGRLAGMEWDPPAPGSVPHHWRHVFSYTTYGAVTRSKLVDRYDPGGQGNYVEDTLAADFQWTMQGQPSFVNYPSGRQLYYSFDSAGRPNGLTAYANWDESPYNPNTWTTKNLVSGASFNRAGQMTTLASSWGGETRTYDDYFRLIAIQGSDLNLSYAYAPAGQDTGRITSETRTDAASSATVAYTYDQLNRLATATSVTSGNTNWGLSFSYDVYGNRTAQTVTAGSAPAFSATFDNNNHMVGYSYDANGNQLDIPSSGVALEYDWENRLKKWTRQGQSAEYSYHPAGWRLSSSAGTNLYGPGGQLLTTLGQRYTDQVYFGGRLLYTMGEGSFDPRLTKLTRIYGDRLGSTRTTTALTYGGGTTPRNYYPFGEELTAPQGGDQFKFASTYRDSATGLDYALNRYLSSTMGRFLTPDPYQASGGPADPQSWNRYSYVHGDPVNFRDPWGLLEAPPGMCPAEYENCGGWAWFGIGFSWGAGVIGGGGGSGTAPPSPSCSISVKLSGSPSAGQTFAGSGNPPPGDQLGAYYVSPSSESGQVGWWFAFQVQVTLYGDEDPSHWTFSQTAALSGSVTYAIPGGSQTYTGGGLPFPDTQPRAQTSGTGYIYAIDAPGIPYYAGAGTILSGNAQWNFTFTATHRASGRKCTAHLTLGIRVRSPEDEGTWKHKP